MTKQPNLENQIQFKSKTYQSLLIVTTAVQCLGILYRLVYEDIGVFGFLYFVLLIFFLILTALKNPGFKKMAGYFTYIVGFSWMAALMNVYNHLGKMTLVVGINDFLNVAIYSLLGYLLVVHQKYLIMPQNQATDLSADHK